MTANLGRLTPCEQVGVSPLCSRDCEVMGVSDDVGTLPICCVFFVFFSLVFFWYLKENVFFIFLHYLLFVPFFLHMITHKICHVSFCFRYSCVAVFCSFLSYHCSTATMVSFRSPPVFAYGSNPWYPSVYPQILRIHGCPSLSHVVFHRC